MAGRVPAPIAWAVVLVLWMLCGCACVRGQSCVPLRDATCSQFVPVGTMIFVPGDPGYSESILELYSNRLVNLLNSVGIYEPCRSYALQMLCITWLRPCQVVNSTTIPLPMEPCMYHCVNYETHCRAREEAAGEVFGLALYFPQGFGAPLNCSNPPIDNWSNSTFYAANTSTYVYQGQSHTLPCSGGPIVAPPAGIDCQSPLSQQINERGVPACVFTCPLPSLTESQYDSVKVMQGIVGWFSWVGSAMLIVAMLFYPRTRDFPRNLILMTACAANVAAAAIIMPTYAGYDYTWCGGSDVALKPDIDLIQFDRMGLPDFTFSIAAETLDFESSLCTFQGAMLQFGFLAAVCWWAIIAFNMCLEVYFGKMLSLEKAKWKWIRFVIYNAVAWGIAFLCMLIPAAAGKIKFSSAGTYCFVSSEDNEAWILTFWFIPVGIALLVGVTLFLFAIIRITVLLITIRKVQKLLFLYLRISIFIFLYLFLFTFIFSYNIQIQVDEGDIETGYEAYYKCLLYAATDCTLPDSVSNYDLVMLKGFAISSLGILLFFIFMSWDILTFYYRLAQSLVVLCLQRNGATAKQVLNMVVYPSSATRSVTLTGSGTLTVTQTGEEPIEMDDEEDEEEEEDGESGTEMTDQGKSIESSSED